MVADGPVCRVDERREPAARLDVGGTVAPVSAAGCEGLYFAVLPGVGDLIP